MLPYFRNSTAFWMVPRLRPVFLLNSSNLQMKNITGHGYNDADRRKRKYSEKTLPQRHFVHHKFRIDCPGIKPWPPR